MPVRIRVIDDCRHIIRINGIPDIVHVRFAALLSDRHFIWEILCHSRQLDDFIVECFDTNLIVAGNVAKIDSFHLEQLLFAFQNVTQKVFVNLIIGQKIILPIKNEISTMKYCDLLTSSIPNRCTSHVLSSADLQSRCASFQRFFFIQSSFEYL